MPFELTELLRQSSNEFIGQLFAEETAEPPGRKKKTVLAKFKVRNPSVSLLTGSLCGCGIVH